jgi:hypothetical protein
MLWKRVTVGDQERILVSKDGRFGGILTPGAYNMFVTPGVPLDLERHNVRDLVFQSVWAEYLVQERRELAERYFTRVETSDTQVAMVYVDRKLFKVMLPAKRMLFWRTPAEVTAEVVDVIASPGNSRPEAARAGTHG